MDLHFTTAEPTEGERAAVDAVLGPVPPIDTRVVRAGAEARAERHWLLPVLHSLQSEVGWVSEGALNYVGRRLTIPPADAFGVASFYALLATRPQAPDVIHACDDVACAAAGATEVLAELERRIGPEGRGDELSWKRSPCLGRCDRGPAVFVQRVGADDFAYGPVQPDLSARPVDGLAELARLSADAGISTISLPQAGGHRLLRRIADGLDPESIEAYRSTGGFTALERALDLGPEWVIDEIDASGLVGRGGAAFPTGRKWRAAASIESSSKFVVCNADESEPGTFKDRVLLEGDPFAVVEALTITGRAVGAGRGYCYVRAEYPTAERRVRHAVEEARNAGYLGHDFDIEVRRGAGAYICGEETALFNSIEGRRGEPRPKPPYPTECGLFGAPTVVNNVETLAAVPFILREGAETFGRLGTAESKGTKLFSVSGDVVLAGVYEVEFGITLGDLLAEAGGARGRLGAVLLGGAAGSFVAPDSLDLPLSFEGVGARGLSLGSGAVVVFDDTTDFGRVAGRIAAFFRDETCGQCVPCRIGTVRQEEALDRLLAGFDALATLEEVGGVMTDASICGLGQTASTAILSAVDLGLIGRRS
jgi:NADH-quinone oxidoreductase subunit F